MAETKDKSALCRVSVIHQESIDKVRAGITDDSSLMEMAGLFKAFSDPTRLKIIGALMLSQMCVCDLAALLAMTQPAISHHLKMLRQARLIKFRREGKVVYYAPDDEHVALLYKMGLAHVDEETGRRSR